MARQDRVKGDGQEASTRPLPRRFPLSSVRRLPQYPWLVVGTVCVGAFMAALDASIVNVALPTIGRAFAVGLNRVEWVSIAYLLTLTTLLVLFGRLADLHGRRRMYSAGFTVFIVGSALAGASPTFALLILARVLQAAGAGMLQANSVAIVTAAAPAGARGRAIGLQAAAQAVGLALGPAVGGLLVSIFSWRAIFYVNVPVGLIGTVLGILILPVDRPPAGPPLKFDYRGAVFLGTALFSLMMALTQGYKVGWTSPLVLTFSALGIVTTILLIRQEEKAQDPLIDPKLVRLPVFAIGNITGLLSYAITFGSLFLLPYEFERVFLLRPAVSGLLLTPIPVAMMFASPYAGRLSDRLGERSISFVGASTFAAGAAACAGVGYFHIALLMVPAQALIGLGMGLFTPPNNSSVMGSVPAYRLGTSGGMLNMARSLGMSMGVAIGATVYAVFLVAYAGSEASLSSLANVAAFRNAFIGFAILGVVAAWLTGTEGRRESKLAGKV